uniref:J domain-containing protein n=1 Tax=Trichuris muris TaxID=70415 RepID=A0A5S6QYS5_TRIMR
MEPTDNLLQCLWSMFVMYITAADGSLQEIERHLEMGKQYLSKGQFSDAIMHYDAALELDPDNYMTLYRRATAYLANGRSKSAIPDLNRVVELKPDFVAARIQRGSILLKQGELDSAEKDFRTVMDRDHLNSDAAENIRKVEHLRQDITAVDRFMNYKDYRSAEAVLNRLVESMPWNERLRLKRAECYERLGALQKAISDIRSATKLVPDNTKALYKASYFSYMLGNLHDAMEGIRDCLKIDPDQQQCFGFYKKLKRLVKVHDSILEATAKEQWKTCLNGADEMLKQETEVTAVITLAKLAQCKCLGMVGQADEAIRACTEVLSHNPNELPALLNRAEAYIQNSEFQQAIHDYQKVLSVDDDNRAAKEGLKKAQNLLKQSKKKDYYKILGVKRNADKATIIKAYRKLAQKWHPDNFDKDQKKKAEEKFIDIAAAKEVLTDPDKRAQYDSGVDPLDPEAQQQSHHPFYQYFQGFDAPFDHGGGPFTFKFHFQ